MNDPVEIVLTRPDVAGLPSYQTPGAAAIDLIAAIEKEVVISPKQTVLIPTGVKLFLKNTQWAAFIIPRSGLGHKHGIILGNTVGLIDPDYQGEIMVSLYNRGFLPYTVIPKQRIAQMLFVHISRPEFKVVSEFSSITERGSGGFGSTGS